MSTLHFEALMKNKKFPSWFTIESYAGTDRLDFLGWKTQLGNRIHQQTLLESGAIDQFDLGFFQAQGSPFYDLGLDANYASDRSVYPLTFGVAQSLIETLPPQLPYQANCNDEYVKSTGKQRMLFNFTADLHASEKELIADFSALIKPLLANIKKNRNPGITPSVIESWSRYQILPYIDLKLWYSRVGEKLPSHTTLAAALFQDGHGDKDTIRSSTIPKAKNALQFYTLRQLSLAKSEAI